MAQGQSPPVFDVVSPYTFKVTVFTLAHKQKSEIEMMGLNERQLMAIDYLRKVRNGAYKDLEGDAGLFRAISVRLEKAADH
jgi:hypothetical protein